MRRRWKYRIVNLFLNIYTKWFGRLCARHSFDEKEVFNNIAIFSSTALGDFLLNTPAIKAIRRRYPAAKITLISHAKNKNLVEGDFSCDWYNRVVYWNNKLFSLPKLLRKLKNEGNIDLAVILHSHPPYDLLASVLSGAKYIFRDNLISMNKVHEFNRWLTNYPVLFYGHYIQRRLDLISLLGAPIDDNKMAFPFSIELPEKTHDFYIIGFQLGASKKEKRWPASYYAELANHLLAKHDKVKIMIIGSKNEEALYVKFISLINDNLKNKIENFTGKTNLPGLIKLISGMDLLVTGDTGPQHIAIILKVKTITLFITTDSRETGPYQDYHLHTIIQPRCQMLAIEKETFGIRGIIKPNFVLEKIESALLSEKTIS